MATSHLTRRLEQKSKRMMTFAIIGIIIIIVLLVKFGDKAVIGISLLLSGKSNTEQTQQNDTAVYISAPIINPLSYSATNSAQITITGLASGKSSVDLYVNNELMATKETKDDGSFTFDHVSLSTGDNQIQAKAKAGKKTSDFSQTISVAYKNSPVTLSIDSPHDGDSFSKDQNTITITGKTDPDAKVTVNDFWAIVDSNGGFTYNLKLHDGDNQIKVIATDTAGNKQEQDLKVTYSQ